MKNFYGCLISMYIYIGPFFMIALYDSEWQNISIVLFNLFGFLLIIAYYDKIEIGSSVKKKIKQLFQTLKKRHQLSQSSTIKSVELQKHYPNGWNIIHQKYPKYSDLQMLSHENEIILAEKQFQEKGTAINAVKSGKLKNEKETIEQNLQLLSQATKTGNIELAETKVKELNNIVERTTIDTELAKAIKDTQKEYRHQYNIGIADTFDISYVDYPCPPRFMQGDNWKYAVAKFPSMGSLVFPYRRRKIARRGYIEDTFQNYLTNEFSRAKLLVLGDCAILPADNYRPYEPDIAIIDVEHPSIRIDIEIDEPYSPITNKPIHYIGCGDDFRDMNLTNLGWIVVRFTEYQVKCDMQSCASFIAQLIYTINPSKSIPQSLLIHAIPQTQKRWTEIEAKVMASEKVREQYLNHQFGFVETEQIEIADITQTEREKFCAKSVKPLMVTPNLTLKTTKDEDSNFERDNHIQFLPQEHIYLYNGQEQFTPVSNVISCFFKPFDSYYWSEHKANQRHVPQGQILEEWDSKSTCSREVGTFMHQQIENYYNGRTYQREFTFTYNGTYIQENDLINIEHEYLQFKDFLKDHDFSPFRTEWAIYDEELKIAGTIDMIHKHGDFFDIYDWKRSSRILDLSGNPIAQNNYGEKGLDALCHIEDTPYWHYCIQQNLYRYIVERNYGIKVGNMYLIVFCSNINTYKKLDVPRMDDTIAAIVKACKTGVVRAKLLSSQQ